MRQPSLSASGFEKYRKKTRKQQFLEEMEVIVPWRELGAAIEPYYPKPEGAGRRPVGVERMLRIHLLQHWFNLSDPAAEEALYDSQALREFVGVDLGREPVPDETTICKFRHLMERYHLGDELFQLINDYLQENGMKISRGTIVDASIIQAPSSTKNREKQRDPEMGSTQKRGQWYFGMKAHIGVDSRSKLIHSVVATAANVSTMLDACHVPHARSINLYYPPTRELIRGSLTEGLNETLGIRMEFLRPTAFTAD
jgi:IS5 family transposase